MRKVLVFKIIASLLFVSIVTFAFSPRSTILNSESKDNLYLNAHVLKSRVLSDEEAKSIKGGDIFDINWPAVIDGVCAISGIGALFRKLNPYVAAFCAGWALGRFLDAWIL